uniref:Uncharacterized protein n=1 Tax=Arundo donax TaxID=35708 RepID=A0A0A9ALW5_ARUDO
MSSIQVSRCKLINTVRLVIEIRETN